MTNKMSDAFKAAVIIKNEDFDQIVTETFGVPYATADSDEYLGNSSYVQVDLTGKHDLDWPGKKEAEEVAMSEWISHKGAEGFSEELKASRVSPSTDLIAVKLREAGVELPDHFYIHCDW